MKEIIERTSVEVQEIAHVLDLGALTIGEEFTLVEAEREESPLTTLQYDVLSMLSMGHSEGRIADRIGVSRRGVRRARAEIPERLEVPTTTVAVHTAIKRGILPVPLVPDETIIQNISPIDRKFITFFADGVPTGAIAEKYSVNARVITSYEQDIFQKLGARTKAHAIRRSHELGLLS